MTCSTCPHVTTVGNYPKDDIERLSEVAKCDACDSEGPNLWVCLHRECLRVGCGEVHKDHSTVHFQRSRIHCLHLNLSTMRVWCYLCETEVFLDNNDPPICAVPLSSPATTTTYLTTSPPSSTIRESDSSESDDSSDENSKPRGLTGLQNIGNTCYMNAALQALSNTPQLTQFFLDCSATVLHIDRKPGLSRSYQRLVQEMWHSRRPSYVIPSGILYGIRNVYPMFRGYQQHDTQEFLRCFMDQLHEELKEPVMEYEEKDESALMEAQLIEDTDDDMSSQSEAEYETCDSGVSEKSSYSDDGEINWTTNDKTSTKRKPVPRLRGGVTPLPPDLSKELKDNTNLAQQKGGVGSAGGDDTPVAEMEGVEFSDAVSDSPMLDNNRKSRSPSPPHEKPRSRLSITKPSPNSTLQRSSSSTNSPVRPVRRKRLVKHRSIISDIFDGKILSSVQCLTCDRVRVSTTIETFQDLSLPIPSRDHLHLLHQGSLTPQKAGLSTCTDVYSGDQSWVTWMWEWMRSWFWGPTISLHDCLSAFFSADELKGDNMYSCDKCHKLRNGVKYSKVLQLPEVLCVHLKRFRHEVMFSAKINSYVSFPLQGLDMRPYLHKDCKSAVTTYDLCAVICHHGTAGGGHYTCYAKHCVSEQWFEYDDQYVTEVTPETVQSCEAYVLFYKKSCEQAALCRVRTMELMERRENSLLQFYVSKQWVNRFNTFAEPGPIDNSDFLCPHGGMHPNKALYVHEMYTVLSQCVWEYLYLMFGGGPACNYLYECAACKKEQEALQFRQNQELEEYKRLSKEFQADDSPDIIYAIAMSWLRLWQAFARGKELETPPTIDNSSIVTNKNGVLVLKPGSDYAQISQEIWSFLHGIYGGGPELILRQGCSSSGGTTVSGYFSNQRAVGSSGSRSNSERDGSNDTNCAQKVQSLDNILNTHTQSVRTSSVCGTTSDYSSTPVSPSSIQISTCTPPTSPSSGFTYPQTPPRTPQAKTNSINCVDDSESVTAPLLQGDICESSTKLEGTGEEETDALLESEPEEPMEP